MADIVLDNVTKKYDDGTIAVDDVNVSIADGEFIILVGPSGCGKSTTLNMIAGLEEVSSGEIRVEGKRVNEKSPRDRDIAMVFQSYALYPHMTVRENVAFPLKLAKLDKATIEAKVDHAAEILELSSLLDRKPSNLSGGQRQRVAMGRAIVRNPKAFLMDEPLSNLDAKLRVQMRTSISRLQKSLNTTTIYVTHDQTEAMTLGDRIVLMRAGVVQQIGSPQELYERPVNLFVAGFIGSPSMNFLSAHIVDNAIESPLGRIPVTDHNRRLLERANGPRDVIIGLRPEAMEDAALVDSANDGVVFTNTVDILESLGSSKLAYFNVEQVGVESEYLAQSTRGESTEDLFGGTQVVAQIDPRSTIREGADLTVWFNPNDLLIFDPHSGKNLTLT